MSNGLDTIAIETVTLSVALSIVICVVIVASTVWLLRKNKTRKFYFLDLARDVDGYPSLARFQFLSWTITILFTILSISLTRLMVGAELIPLDKLPSNLIALMGISVSVTPASAYISKLKYGEPSISGQELTNEQLKTERKTLPFAGMLFESGRPSLTRFQMFSWTIISITIFLGKLGSIFVLKRTITEFTIPDIETIMVLLMGLSQGAYVGGKWISPSSMYISSVYPKMVREGDVVTITGYNFGTEKQDVLFNYERIDKANIMGWDEHRIDFKAPRDITDIEEETIVVKVNNKEVAYGQAI